MTALALDKICIDGGTQSRAALNDEAVADYSAAIRDGTDFPPVVVFFDGKHHWLADGFHRFHAYRRAGATDIPADVRKGTKRDAVLFSVGANKGHGLRPTNADKRCAVAMALAHPEGSKWSDRAIATHCGVDHKTVAKIRADLTGEIPSDERAYTTKHGTTAVMKTAKIGKSAKTTKKAEREAEQAAWDQKQDAFIAGLPDDIKNGQRAAARNGARNAVVPRQGLTPADRIAELEEAVKVLEQEAVTLRAENKTFGDMKVQFEQGGFAKVIAGKDEEIRVLKRRVEQESAEKVKNLRRGDYFLKILRDKYKWSTDIVIDLEEPANG